MGSSDLSPSGSFSIIARQVLCRGSLHTAIVLHGELAAGMRAMTSNQQHQPANSSKHKHQLETRLTLASRAAPPLIVLSFLAFGTLACISLCPVISCLWCLLLL
jgi:hypothetical protein